MAEKNTVQTLQDHEAICHQWVLQFDTNFIWRKILGERTFSVDVREMINGLLKRLVLSNISQHKFSIGKEAYFLWVLAALADLHVQNSSKEKDSLFSALDEEEEETVMMQDILTELIDKLTDLCSSDDIKERLVDIRQETLLQCVYVHCRVGNYEAAQAFFKRNKTEFDKESSRRADAVLHTKNKPHKYLTLETLDAYLDKMFSFLEEVHTTFGDPPFILQLAQDLVALPKKYQNRTHISVPEPGKWSAVYEDQLQRKLTTNAEKMREQVARKMGMSPRAKQQGRKRTHSSSDAGETDRETRSSSLSPKKQQLSRTGNRNDADGREADRAAHEEELEEEEEPDLLQSSEEDSAGSPSRRGKETSASPSRRRNLHQATVRRSLAPQMKYRYKVQSSKRQKWTDQEEEEFYQLVQQYGVGAWADIRAAWKSSRTGVMLKDKWRNIVRNSYDRLCKKFGPVDYWDGE